MSQEDFWNNKWKKEVVLYNGRTLRLGQTLIKNDVKNFITVNDNLLQKVVEQYGLKRSTYNETAHACQKFVVEYMDYISDTKTSNSAEFWQFPFESLASKTGDCEDGAILMASLMINAGIPSWRVKVCAGYVRPEPTAPQGGHAYCIYLADRKDNSLEWEIHDWCYYEDSEIPTGEKPLAKDGGYKQTYGKLWFSFNNEYSWSAEEIEISGRVKA